MNSLQLYMHELADFLTIALQLLWAPLEYVLLWHLKHQLRAALSV